MSALQLPSAATLPTPSRHRRTRSPLFRFHSVTGATHRSLVIAASAVATAAACSLGITQAPQATAQSSLPDIATLAPAPILDQYGRPNVQILQQMENLSQQPWLPEEIRSTLTRAIAFFRGTGEPGVDLPKNGPAITQFGWPTVAQQCIGGDKNSIGTAMMTPGPASLPLPGVPAGQVGFVFTALGTGPVAETQSTQMTVHWINLTTLKWGATPLTYNGINPEGPSTINGVADTGSGLVLAALEGGVTTSEDSGPTNCNYLPTVGLTQVS